VSSSITPVSAFSLINRDNKKIVFGLKVSLVAAAVEIAFSHFDVPLPDSIVVATVVALGLCVFILLKAHTGSQAKNRHFGQALEKDAVKDLAKAIPSGWKIQLGLRSNGGGDIDICLRTNIGIFAIEVKAYHGLKVVAGSLVKMNGDRLTKDPIRQAQQAAQTVEGIAIVWMPAAKSQNTFLLDGVKIVSGDAKYLIKQLSS